MPPIKVTGISNGVLAEHPAQIIDYITVDLLLY
jgi:hypothetical protein